MTVTRAEVLQAADILERLSVVYEAFSPEHYPWSPIELRVEAEHVLAVCGWCEE